jgi:hypothetical protein
MWSPQEKRAFAPPAARKRELSPSPLLRAARPLLPRLLLPLLLAAAALPRGAQAEAACESLLTQFQAFNSREAVPYGGDNMIYFLHIPRQGITSW